MERTVRCLWLLKILRHGDRRVKFPFKTGSRLALGRNDTKGHLSGIPGSLCSGFLTRPFQGLPYRRTMMDADSVAHPATDHDLCRRHFHRF